MSVSRSLVIDWWLIVLNQKNFICIPFSRTITVPSYPPTCKPASTGKKTEPTYLMTDFKENLTWQFPLVHFQSVILGNVGVNYLLGARLRVPRFILTI